ncbi:MAG: hypothetical protein QM278_11345 [Pseudomonadota bacterium]|nr:hypothetical protein [Pseudomonadota bacterium]
MGNNYYEVVLEGRRDYIDGFVHGLIAGRGGEGDVFFGKDLRIDEERPLEILGRLAGLRGEHTTLVVEKVVLDMLEEALGMGRREGPMRLVSARRIREASFTYAFVTFSRETGAALDAILSALPPGVFAAPPYAPAYRETPEGQGVEAYAPLHDYEMKAAGRIRGECGGVCRCHELLSRHEVVELGPMELGRTEA